MFVKQKSILTAAILAAFMFIGIIGQSHAASITYMSAYYPNDWGDGANVTVSLGTDADIQTIRWSVNGTVERWTIPSRGTRSVSENFTLTGNIKGTKYEVEAKVYFGDIVSDTETVNFRVFKPKVISGIKYPRGVQNKHKRGDGIYGSVTLWRHYHDGQNIVVAGSAHARNGTNMTLGASVFYRHTRFHEDGRTLWKVEDPPLDEPNPYADDELEPGETYNHSGSSAISFSVPTDSGDIGPTDKFIMNAHIHMEVGGQVWHDEGGAWTHTFTEEDNQ